MLILLARLLALAILFGSLALIIISLNVTHLNKRAELTDNKHQRQHERKLAREKRNYDTLQEYVQDKEFDDELNTDHNN